MRRSLLIGLTLAASLLGSSIGSAEHPSDSRPYVAGAGDSQILCGQGPNGEDVGGACFELDVDLPRAINVKIEDATTLAVGGYYQLERADGSARAGNFCDAVSEIEVPADAVRLLIFIDEATGAFDETRVLTPPVHQEGTEVPGTTIPVVEEEVGPVTVDDVHVESQDVLGYPIGGGCLSKHGSPGAGVQGTVTIEYIDYP